MAVRPLLDDDAAPPAARAVFDAIRAAQIATADDFNYTPYVVAGVVFVCLTVPMARIADRVARAHGQHLAGGVV